jgi:hypothetical protein
MYDITTESVSGCDTHPEVAGDLSLFIVAVSSTHFLYLASASYPSTYTTGDSSSPMAFTFVDDGNVDLTLTDTSGMYETTLS